MGCRKSDLRIRHMFQRNFAKNHICLFNNVSHFKPTKIPRYLEMQCTGEVRRISNFESSQLLILHVCVCVCAGKRARVHLNHAYSCDCCFFFRDGFYLPYVLWS